MNGEYMVRWLTPVARGYRNLSGNARRAAACLMVMVVGAVPRASAQPNVDAGARVGPSTSARQEFRAVRFLPGVLLGGTLPAGELGDVYNTGVRVGATLTAIVPTRPYGVRAALTYDRLAGGTIVPPGGVLVEVDAATMVSLTVEGLVSERAERSALLYFTAGAGVHRLDARSVESLIPDDDEPTDDPDNQPPAPGAETKFGGSVGGGLTFRIGDLPSYLEVKVVKLFGADAVLVPVVVGIQFGR